jgi:hypothetical protein
VLPRWLNSQPSLAPADRGEKGPIDRATRAEKHTVGDNSVATVEVPRESVLENEEMRTLHIDFTDSLQPREDVNALSASLTRSRLAAFLLRCMVSYFYAHLKSEFDGVL